MLAHHDHSYLSVWAVLSNGLSFHLGTALVSVGWSAVQLLLIPFGEVSSDYPNSHEILCILHMNLRLHGGEKKHLAHHWRASSFERFKQKKKKKKKIKDICMCHIARLLRGSVSSSSHVEKQASKKKKKKNRMAVRCGSKKKMFMRLLIKEVKRIMASDGS
jgi:hypothetical protein